MKLCPRKDHGNVVYVWRCYHKFRLNYLLEPQTYELWAQGSIDHCRNFVDPIDHTNRTQSIEGQLRILKSGLSRGGYHRKYVAWDLYARLWGQQYECRSALDTMTYFLH